MNSSRKTFLCMLLAALLCVCAFAVNVSGAVVAPDSEVTVAEAISLAARASAAYQGETIATAQGGNWYDAYVNYAIDEGFVGESEFDSYTRPAKRYEVAALFGKALPAEVYSAINSIAGIPDVSKAEGYYSTLLSLYNAGVVVGSDDYGNFYPESEITRVEMDSIVNRVAFVDERIHKEFRARSSDDAYSLAYVSAYDYSKEGAPSGWLLNNNAGTPRLSLTNGYNTLTDVSTTQGSEMIREFNKTETGKFTLNTKVELYNGFNGFALEFRNEAGDTVYKLVTANSEWNIVGADGSLTAITSGASSRKEFTFTITIDLDNLESKTVINGVELENGTQPLCVDAAGANLYNFRFATGDAETISAILGTTEITANYAVYDNFDWGTGLWQGTGMSVSGTQEMILAASGNASRGFDPTSGNVIGNFMAFLDGTSFTYDVKSQGESLVTLSADSTSLYANGTKVYDYTSGLWYRFRVEVDTFAHTAVIYVNGRNVKEINLTNTSTSVNEISFANTGSANILIDRVNVYAKQTHDDYVPTPEVPVGQENYTVGINVCNLWKNGYTSLGWSHISPYSGLKPVLGYYDEGTPEAADWEIKYMVEHGIDFQAVCWYPTLVDGVLKGENEHLYDGYMFAEYSDMMKYAIIWEASGTNPTLPEFNSTYIPYLVENYFKDDRYMMINNEYVFIVYYAGGLSNLADGMGGNASLAEGFKNLEKAVKEATGNGVLFLASGIGNEADAAGLDTMGFDGNYAYNWGRTGHDINVNKERNTSIAAASPVYTVPTISVGFNNIAWHGQRLPMMSASDFEAANRWAVNEYLPGHATEAWQQNFVMLSTWNEYGEGTYMMPTAEDGFGYLDAVRKVYTNKVADSSINTRPSEDQLYRINHLYPQYRHLLRNNGEYVETEHEGELSTEKTINYNQSSSFMATINGIKTSGLSNVKYSSSGLSGTINGDGMVYKTGVNANASDVKYIKLYMAVKNNTEASVFFTTSEDSSQTSWSTEKGFNVVATKAAAKPSDDPNEVILDVSSLLGEEDENALIDFELLIDTSTNPNWNGTIRGLRVDPSNVNGDSFKLVKVELLGYGGKGRSITVDGITSDMRFYSETSTDGQYLMAFDPKIVLDYKLDAFHTWDKDAGVLTLDINGHEVVYTVGSSNYTLDGAQKALGYTLYLEDGLPMIPIQKLCSDVGYTCTATEADGVNITTAQSGLVSNMPVSTGVTTGAWEFNTDGYTEGWGSEYLMRVGVADGALVTESVTMSGDPVIRLGDTLDWDASDYTTLKIRAKFNHSGDTGNNNYMQLFFATTGTEMSQANSYRIPLGTNDTDGEWVTFTVDLTDNSNWTGTITELRLDPFNASSGEMDIDYIRFS